MLIDLSRLKGFHLRFAQKWGLEWLATGVSDYIILEVLELNGSKYRFHSYQNSLTCVRFSCVERANILCTDVIMNKDVKWKLTILGGQTNCETVLEGNQSQEIKGEKTSIKRHARAEEIKNDL